MKERAKEVGANLQINSEIGEGTHVMITLPLDVLETLQ